MHLLIILIESETHIRTTLCEKLERDGYTSLPASNDVDGLRMIKLHRPHLIICNYCLPYSSALELCQQLSEDESTRSIPVIVMISGGYYLFEKQRLSSIKATIMKPFSPRQLLEVIKGVLNQEGVPA